MNPEGIFDSQVVHGIRLNPNRLQTDPPASTDGVFFNLVAKPHRPKTLLDTTLRVSELPKYEDVGNLVPPEYTDIPTPADDVSGVEFDGLTVGSYASFAIALVVASLIRFYGFIFAYALTTTYAGRYGSLAGLGLSIFFLGFPRSFGVDAVGVEIQDPLLSVCVGMIGMCIFFFSFLSFVRMRMLALQQNGVSV